MVTTETSTDPTTNPLAFGDGNLNGEILLIGEYFSAEEAHKSKPLVGSAGFELRKIFSDSGLDWNNTYRTVVAAERPLGNDPRALFYPTTEKKSRTYYNSCYPRESILSGARRIQALILRMPNLKLIIGLGNLPLWLLTDKASVSTVQGYKVPSGAMKWRGSQLYTLGGIPYLPLIAPTTILKDWSFRHPTVHDLKARAKRFLEGKPWTRDEPTFNPKPTFEEAIAQLDKWQARTSLGKLKLSADIETWRRSYISCIGLADKDTAICIPFFYFGSDGNMIDVYTPEQEVTLWLAIRRLLSHDNTYTIGQNFIYDHQFLSRLYFIQSSFGFDTMLGHHLLWPGTPKSLDYLASLYCDHYIYWKDESQDWDGAFNHESLWLYNCKDVRETYDISEELESLIEKLNFSEQWKLQKAQWLLARDMMKRGIAINHPYLKAMSSELTTIAYQLEELLLSSMPEDLRYATSGTPWFSSPAQQKIIFYDVLGLKPILHKKTKKPTLDASALPQLKEQQAWLSTVFTYLENLRSISVFRSHFLDVKLSFDKRFRCNFNVGGTETFRWSSSANGFGEGTNGQNIPKGDD